MSGTDTPAPKVSRTLLVTLGVAMMAGLAAYVFLIAPGSADETVADAGPVAPDAGAPAADDIADESLDPSPAPTEIADVEPTFQVFRARDPFEQLVSDDTGGAVGDTQQTAAPAGTTAPAAPTEPGAPAVPGDDDPVELPATPVTGDPAQTTVGLTTIMLEEVFSDGGVDTALVRVDDEGYEATEGETVANGLTVLDIGGNCATMRFDDRRFILCEGEQIQK